MGILHTESIGSPDLECLIRKDIPKAYTRSSALPEVEEIIPDSQHMDLQSDSRQHCSSVDFNGRRQNLC